MFCSILVFHVRDMLSSRLISDSLRSRRLEVVGTRKNGRARRRHARVEVFSLARARSLFGHYFQAPATQAIFQTFIPCFRWF